VSSSPTTARGSAPRTNWPSANSFDHRCLPSSESLSPQLRLKVANSIALIRPNGRRRRSLVLLNFRGLWPGCGGGFSKTAPGGSEDPAPPYKIDPEMDSDSHPCQPVVVGAFCSPDEVVPDPDLRRYRSSGTLRATHGRDDRRGPVERHLIEHVVFVSRQHAHVSCRAKPLRRSEDLGRQKKTERRSTECRVISATPWARTTAIRFKVGRRRSSNTIAGGNVEADVPRRDLTGHDIFETGRCEGAQQAIPARFPGAAKIARALGYFVRRSRWAHARHRSLKLLNERERALGRGIRSWNASLAPSPTLVRRTAARALRAGEEFALVPAGARSRLQAGAFSCERHSASAWRRRLCIRRTAAPRSPSHRRRRARGKGWIATMLNSGQPVCRSSTKAKRGGQKIAL